MIETQREMSNGVHVTFCEFTVDETYSMARFVMDCLCLPWIDNYPEFHKALRDVFFRCSRGKDITSEMIMRLLDKFERFNDKGFDLPNFPKIKDGGRIMAPKDKHGKDAVDWLEKEKSRIWHESWENHTNIRKTGGFWVFPGAEPDEMYLRHQRSREERFWAEVDAKQAEWDCGRQEAIRAVSDHMPRAESEFQLADPRLDEF